ncbi:MAG: selenium-dependent molybdenum cofactor biosynthesis protein YqeB [Desulfobacterales bacterium]|nr:selenium-dependent molybdenum cofactor biosynthesis protein YqeB [Desulfobacterales bacterium]
MTKIKRTEGNPIRQLRVVLRGAGETASGVAWRLYRANIHRLVMLEVPAPLAVRRSVCFCEALHQGWQTVEGVQAVKAADIGGVQRAWDTGQVPVLVDPEGRLISQLAPDVLVDATLAKRNLGTRIEDAPLVIGLGPGFSAGRDVHRVIETNRGHNLGRVIIEGAAEPDTGVPGNIAGFSAERVLRAPAAGVFSTRHRIGERVQSGEVVGSVAGAAVTARLDGILRGLIRPGTVVTAGLKLGDVDPRGEESYCHTISDKARAVAGGVLEAILGVFNV